MQISVIGASMALDTVYLYIKLAYLVKSSEYLLNWDAYGCIICLIKAADRRRYDQEVIFHEEAYCSGSRRDAGLCGRFRHGRDPEDVHQRVLPAL